MSEPHQERMVADLRHLDSLLAQLMALVSQQFFHMIALERRGFREQARRIRCVDDEDFKTAMKIIEAILHSGDDLLINAHAIRPAGSLHDILQTERRSEMEFAKTLNTISVRDPKACQLLDLASKPRNAYLSWLEAELARTDRSEIEAQSQHEEAALVALLLQLMEQTLVHAMSWHLAGKQDASNTAWQISGASMLYLRALAEIVLQPGSPEINVPPWTIGPQGDRFLSDIGLIMDVKIAANLVANTSDDHRLRKVCKTIEFDCEGLSKTVIGHPIAAKLGYSPVFSDFNRAVARMNSPT